MDEWKERSKRAELWFKILNNCLKQGALVANNWPVAARLVKQVAGAIGAACAGCYSRWEIFITIVLMLFVFHFA